RSRPRSSSLRTALPAGRLRGGTQQHQATLGPGQRALDEDQVLLRVDRLDRQVLHGVAHATHAAGHAHALEDPARRGAGADGAGRTVLALNAVARPQAAEPVPLHDTGEPLALGLTGDVDDRARLERLDGDLLAERVLARVGRAQLHQVAAGGGLRLRE